MFVGFYVADRFCVDFINAVVIGFYARRFWIPVSACLRRIISRSCSVTRKVMARLRCNFCILYLHMILCKQRSGPCCQHEPLLQVSFMLFSIVCPAAFPAVPVPSWRDTSHGTSSPPVKTGRWPSAGRFSCCFSMVNTSRICRSEQARRLSSKQFHPSVMGSSRSLPPSLAGTEQNQHPRLHPREVMT